MVSFVNRTGLLNVAQSGSPDPVNNFHCQICLLIVFFSSLKRMHFFFHRLHQAMSEILMKQNPVLTKIIIRQNKCMIPNNVRY